MKGAIKSMLSAFGLAPASQADQLTKETRDLAAKVVKLEERLAQARADSENWKRRHAEGADALGGWKQAASRAQADTDVTKREVERLQVELKHSAAELKRKAAENDEWKRRTEHLTSETEDLRTRLHNTRARLEEAERAATSANEHLMAMEVKLDLIEAAIQVLDTRTREAAVARS